MTAYSGAQITANFPTDTTVHTLSTIKLLDLLVRDGFLDDTQALQVMDAVGTYIDTKAEVYAIASAVYTGAAGATTRNYALVPKYALPATTLGQNLEALPNPGPLGRGYGDANTVAATQGGRTARYGKKQADTAVAATAATLDATHYVTVTAPAASADFPGVTFDVLVDDGSGTYEYIGNVAAGAALVDNGLARKAYSMAPNANAKYTHAEVGVDTATNPHTVIYGSNVFVRGANG